jgi:hypothetical protein
MRSTQFALQGKQFRLETEDNGDRRYIDQNRVEWSDQDLIVFAGETAATTAIAYALRDIERYGKYRLPDER